MAYGLWLTTGRGWALSLGFKKPVLICHFLAHFGSEGIEFELPSVRIDRTESGSRSVAICVAANCGPAGMKPAETFLAVLNLFHGPTGRVWRDL